MKRHDNQNLTETAGLKPNHAKTKRNKENQEGPEVDRVGREFTDGRRISSPDLCITLSLETHRYSET